MPKAVHDLVDKLLADTSFYPDLDEEKRKSRAWAVAEKQLNSSEEGNFFFATDPDEPSFTLVRAADSSASMLLFKNAVVARAETNKNQDAIDEQGTEELAATIAGWPIDIEHGRHQIVGMFTSGHKGKDLTTRVDGAIWADRYPNEAAGVMEGRLHLSIEAKAETAKCSVCQKVFGSAGDYCEHLSSRRTGGAVRHLSGLKARGGALTRRPAGTKTTFDPDQIYLVASHQETEEDGHSGSMPMKDKEQDVAGSWYDQYLKDGETINDLPASDFADPEGRRFPYKIHGVVKPEGWKAAWSAAHGGHTGTADSSAVTKLKRDKPQGVTIEESIMKTAEELKQELDAALAKITDLEAKNTALDEMVKAKDGELTTVKASLTEAQAKVGELTASTRRARLGKFITDEDWAKDKDVIASLPDAAFELVATKLVVIAKDPPRKEALVLGSNGSDAGDRLTLR